jgi:hypothetical protein
VQRGLAPASIRALIWEGRYFLSWYTAQNSVDDFTELNIKNIDTYFAMRAAAGLRRRSLKDVGGATAFIDAISSSDRPRRGRSGTSNYRSGALRL